MKISTNTIIRTIILIIALANQILTAFGKNPLPIAEEEIYEIVSTIATIIVSMWAWWKNNSFSQSAIRADEFMKELKNDDSEWESDVEQEIFESEVE